MYTLLTQRTSHRSLTPGLLALVIALTVQPNGFAADATVDPVHATHVANGTMPPDKPKDEPAMTLVVAQLREKVAQLEAQLAKMAPNQPPVLATNAGANVDQRASQVISAAMLQATDADSPADQLTFSVSTLPAHGRLELVAAPGTSISKFTQEDIDRTIK